MLREIGRGTTGVVYLGQDPLQGRSVALKVAHAPEARDAAGADVDGLHIYCDLILDFAAIPTL